MDNATASLVGHDFVRVDRSGGDEICAPRSSIRELRKLVGRSARYEVALERGGTLESYEVDEEEYARLARELSLEGLLEKVFELSFKFIKKAQENS